MLFRSGLRQLTLAVKLPRRAGFADDTHRYPRIAPGADDTVAEVTVVDDGGEADDNAEVDR